MNLAVIFGTIAYETFVGVFITAVGGGILVLITTIFARVLRDRRYSDSLKVYSRAAAWLFTAAAALLIFAMGLANSLNPTPAILLAYLVSIWGVPLAITLLFLIASAGLMFLFHKKIGPPSGPQDYSIKLLPSLMAGSAALSGILSLVFYNLLNSYMLTPSVPLGLSAVINASSLSPLSRMELMVNPSWLPLSIKLFLVGCVTFAILFSGSAAFRRIRTKVRDEKSAWLDFLVSWSFKLATVFGASLGIIGYWCAAALHTSVPSLAMMLMGEAAEGTSPALMFTMNSLWDVATACAMSLGALAGVYYLSRGKGFVLRGSNEQKVLKMFLPLLLMLLAVATYGVLVTGNSYPQQFVLAIGVFVGGYLTLEAIRRYYLGKARLYVPAFAFTVSCYALLLYQAPNTKWYNAVAFGGVSWPLIGFPLLAVTLYYFATRWREMKYWIPVAVAVTVLLIVTAKVADVALVRGSTVLALDPRLATIVQNWAQQTGSDLTFLYTQYPVPNNSELFVGLLCTFILFLGMFYWFERLLSHVSRLELKHVTEEVHQ